jgi:hypothetical protein
MILPIVVLSFPSLHSLAAVLREREEGSISKERADVNSVDHSVTAADKS